jgi:hypothetical protein
MTPTPPEDTTPSAARARRLVLCLDGTWNSTYTRKKRDDDHYVIKPSNILKLARAILPRSPTEPTIGAALAASHFVTKSRRYGVEASLRAAPRGAARRRSRIGVGSLATS